MVWLVLGGAVGAIWLFAIAILALVEGDIGTDPSKGRTLTAETVARAQEQAPAAFPVDTSS